MKAIFVFTVLIIIFVKSSSHSQAISSKMLLNKAFVDLKGKEGRTIFINETADTLKLNCTFFNWLPYTETRDELTIAPGEKSKLILLFNFPDFIRINNQFAVFNRPTDTLVCHIKKYTSSIVDIHFEGSLAPENAYYLSYQQFLENIDQESRPYYKLSEELKDWNLFPTKGDSITKARLKFLKDYNGPLPAWFKAHEHRRLLYNNYFGLSNALMSNEFHHNHKISVDDNYYNFEKLLNKDNDMVLNETYLYCMNEYFGRQAKLAKLPNATGNIYVIDKLYHQTDVGDVNLMRALGLLYRNDKSSYDTIISTIKFKKLERKFWLDSLVQTKLGNPKIGKEAPEIALTDSNSKVTSLNDYVGKVVIINFWADWCGPCIAEFPHENKWFQQYKNKGLVVINVCFDSDRDRWKQISKRDDLQMVNLFTAKADYLKLLKQYNLTAPPRSVLINREGKIADNYLKRASMLTNKEIDKILANN